MFQRLLEGVVGTDEAQIILEDAYGIDWKYFCCKKIKIFIAIQLVSDYCLTYIFSVFDLFSYENEFPDVPAVMSNGKITR